MEPTTAPGAAPTAFAGLRYLIVTLVTYLVTSGKIDAANAEGIIALIGAVATVAFGLYRTYKTNKAKAV